MFERYTDQARRVVVLSSEQARGLGHGYIGTEHLLLGLIAEGKGPAARVLDRLDITLAWVRDQIVDTVGRGTTQGVSGHIPFTPRAKKVLELSLREALANGQRWVGTGHILLALLTEGQGLAVQFLVASGTNVTAIRGQVREQIAGEPEPETDAAGGPGPEAEITAQRGPADLPRPPQVSWHEVLLLVDAIEQRLTVIEEQLGISAEDAAGGTASEPPEDPAAAPD